MRMQITGKKKEFVDEYLKLCEKYRFYVGHNGMYSHAMEFSKDRMCWFEYHAEDIQMQEDG